MGYIASSLWELARTSNRRLGNNLPFILKEVDLWDIIRMEILELVQVLDPEPE